jgi:adenylate cyclase
MGQQDHKVERRLAAILAADVAGYSRLMSQDEAGTLRSLTLHREIMDRLIAEHGGRIANTAGDSVLAEFPSASVAVQCAVEVQTALTALNEEASPDCALRFRIGIHLGDILVKAGDLFGDAVNIAARVQGLAEPGGLCLSGEAYTQVRKSFTVKVNDLGPQHLKNIDEPVKVYAIRMGGAPGAAGALGGPKSPISPDRPSLAVLPFKSASGDPAQDYLLEGITDDLITSLYRIKWLVVIARGSSFAFKGEAVSPQQVGQALGVRYVLDGSIRQAGNRIRVTAHLIETASNAHAWTDRFEGSLEDIFALQDQIAESVAGAVEPTIRRAEVSRARTKPTESLDAYDLYLRALPLHYSNIYERLAEAQRLLARAIEIDPNYSTAKAFSALTTVIQTNQGWTSPPEQDQGVRLAREALADHKDDPVILRCGGHALAYLAHEHDLAVALLERALALHPNSAEVHHSTGWVLNFACDGFRAIEHFHRAMRLSPLDPEMGHTLMGLTFAQLLMGRYEEALQTSRKAMAAMPTSLSPLRAAILACDHLGMTAEMKAVAANLLAISPGFRVGQFSKLQPFKDEQFAKSYMTALRKADLPE